MEGDVNITSESQYVKFLILNVMFKTSLYKFQLNMNIKVEFTS